MSVGEEYHDELELIIDNAESQLAAVLFAVVLKEYGLSAGLGRFTVENAVGLLKNIKSSLKISSGIDVSMIPAVIASLDLLRNNKPIGSLYSIAKKAAYSVSQQVEKYYDNKTFTAVGDRETSAKSTARWMIRNAIFVAQEEAAKSLGKTAKKWVTRGDSRVRHSHQALDGQTIPLTQQFTIPNSGIAIRYPGDMTAPLSETINCRCSMEFL